MDIEKMIQQTNLFQQKTMSELIADKHNKKLRDLNYLCKKWLPESQDSKT